MDKVTVLFGTQGSGKTTIASNLAGKRKTYRAEFYTPEDPLNLSHVLHAQPEVIIVDECPLNQLYSLVRLANNKVLRYHHPVTGMHEMETPEIIVVIQNHVSAQEVFAIASGRNIKLFQCKVKEVVNA